MENQEYIKKSIQKVVLAMARDPKNTELYHELAKYYAMQEDYDKVVSVYETLLSIDAQDEQAILNIGSIYYFEKEYRKALKYFERAMVVNPSNYLVYYNLANTYAEMKNF